MTTEQLYLLAREFCARLNVRITNFAALAAAAAASTAKVEGIAIHDNHRDAARAMAEVLARVPALTKSSAWPTPSLAKVPWPLVSSHRM